MGLQKYRADDPGPKQVNGGTPWYTNWMGGPTLALIRDCKIENASLAPRTVYIQNVADTYFSQPAACKYKGKTITGYVATDDNGEYIFRAHIDQNLD